jgi:RNA polymerase sigma-70 factor (ECF subfamily)
MAHADSTCWTIIQAAAAGSPGDRAAFALRYDPIVRAYLTHRWRTSSCQDDIEDTVQEVFVECFKQNGVLDRAEPGRPGGFRALLYGVVQNIALRQEMRMARQREQQPPSGMNLEEIQGDEESLSRAFDQAWAIALVREAAEVHERRARDAGAAALRRVELLRLRFQENLPIRDIAHRWQTDPAGLHHEYARARKEFKEALREVVAFHHPGSPVVLEQECAKLLALFG